MRTLIIIVAMASISFTVLAQQDTTKKPVQKAVPNIKSQTKNTKNNNPGFSQEEKSFPTKNMVKVAPDKISEGLIKTLDASQYKGWEKGSIYFDTKTNEYALLMPTMTPEEANMKYNRDINAKKTPNHTGWYYFTKDGQPID